MKYLLIDTCDWIELGKNLPEPRRKLFDLIYSKDVTIVLPEIVVSEWNRNKESKIVSSKRDQFQTYISHTEKVIEFLPENQRTSFLKAIENIPEEAIQQHCSEGVKEIDTLFQSNDVKHINASDNAKILAAQLALDNKAPFKPKKNSMADALILLSFLGFIKRNEIEGGYFISRNTSDFSEKGSIHPDLAPLLEQNNVSYFANIGEALNKIKPGTVPEEEISKIEQRHQVEDLMAQLEVSERMRLSSLEAIGDVFTASMLNPFKEMSSQMQNVANSADHIFEQSQMNAQLVSDVVHNISSVNLIDKSILEHPKFQELIQPPPTTNILAQMVPDIESSNIQEAINALSIDTASTARILDSFKEMSSQIQNMTSSAAYIFEQSQLNAQMISDVVRNISSVNLIDKSMLESPKFQELIQPPPTTNILAQISSVAVKLPHKDNTAEIVETSQSEEKNQENSE